MAKKGVNLMANVACSTNCGIDELYDLYDPDPLMLLHDAFNTWNRRYPPAFCFFSDVVEGRGKKSHADKLAALIEKHPFLGTIHPSSERTNYNSGNKIQAWLWELPERRKTYVRRSAKRLGIRLEEKGSDHDWF